MAPRLKLAELLEEPSAPVPAAPRLLFWKPSADPPSPDCAWAQRVWHRIPIRMPAGCQRSESIMLCSRCRSSGERIVNHCILSVPGSIARPRRKVKCDPNVQGKIRCALTKYLPTERHDGLTFLTYQDVLAERVPRSAPTAFSRIGNALTTTMANQVVESLRKRLSWAKSIIVGSMGYGIERSSKHTKPKSCWFPN